MEEDDDSRTCTTASFCPSFSTYSGDRLAETADRVGREVAGEADDYPRKEKGVASGGGDEEFEFVNLRLDRESDGLCFPVFDRNLISQSCAGESGGENDEVWATAVITPLRDLFLRDRDDAASSSDDEADELDEIPSEIYSPWTLARSTAEMSASGGCKKSKSTGSSSTSPWSSKRWRFKDLLKRSHSDGKQSLVFLNSNSVSRNNRAIEDKLLKKKKEEKKEKTKEISAHEQFYLRNKAMKEEGKRKSYLPYRQDLVGLFANISGYGRTFPSF